VQRNARTARWGLFRPFFPQHPPRSLLQLKELIKYLERSLSKAEKELEDHVITEFGVEIPYKKLSVEKEEVVIAFPVKPEEIAKGTMSLKLKPILKIDKADDGGS